MKQSIRVKQFSAGSCYSYILSSDKQALIIDPHISLRADYVTYLAKNKLQFVYILDTHTHADHFSLASVLKKECNAPVLMHQKAISEVASRRLSDNEEIKFAQGSFKVLYTPGHTDDAISIYCEGMLFTGDVLLIGSVGRTDFQNGSPESMFDTLQRIKSLPQETIIYPGHDYHGLRASVLSKEKTTNPFLLQADKEVFVKNMRAKIIPKPFNIDNIVRVNQKGEAVSLEMISPAQAQQLRANDANIKFLDVRSALEFSQAHIKDSVNIPIDMLTAKLNELSNQKQTYIVFCRTGNRSPMAADMLMQSGIHSVKVMDGGMNRWQKEKRPVIKGEGGISLERQVRVIAGSLAFAGIALSWFVHPYCIGISVFVSCGLIYAGLTDNCLMGMLLMKLPYNKKLYKTKLGGGTCSMSN